MARKRKPSASGMRLSPGTFFNCAAAIAGPAIVKEQPPGRSTTPGGLLRARRLWVVPITRSALDNSTFMPACRKPSLTHVLYSGAIEQVTAAAAIIAVSVAGTGAVAVILRALGMLSRSNGEQMACPICGHGTRFHDPYPMCDECKRCVGVRINGKAHASR
jgi:hypothetical protein